MNTAHNLIIILDGVEFAFSDCQYQQLRDFILHGSRLPMDPIKKPPYFTPYVPTYVPTYVPHKEFTVPFYPTCRDDGKGEK